MKTHHQNTWQFAKLFLAALVFAVGVVACGGGGGGGGGGTSAGIVSGSQLAIKSVSIEAATPAPVESSGAGTLSARSAFVIAANADFILSVTVENTGGTVSPANTSFVLYRSDDKATLEEIGDVVGTYAVGAVAAESERVITQEISVATLSTDSTKPTRFVVEGQFAGETDVAGEEAVSNDYLGVEVYTDADGGVVNEDELITGNTIVAVIDYDWSATVTVSASAAVVGERITLTAVVTNNADSRAPRASLVFYRSTDTTIADTDDSVVTFSIRPLAAAATVIITATDSPTAGAYYYGACVVGAGDNVSTNDCSTGIAVAVTPKYGALAFEATASDWFGDASVNQPTQALAHSEAIRLCGLDGGTNCRVLATFTAHIAYAGGVKSGDDTKAILAWATRDTLASAVSAATAKCVTDGGASSGDYACAPLGTFSDEYDSSHSNSPATAGTETSGSEEVASDIAFEADPVFDLSVTAFSVNPSSVAGGGSVTFLSTVTNAASSNASSPAADLNYYQSTDSTISTSDTLLGFVDVSALAPGRTSSLSASVTAPSSAGSYYFGACLVEAGTAADVFADNNTSNNCSTSARLTVTSSSGGGGGGGGGGGSNPGDGSCYSGLLLTAGNSCTLSGGGRFEVNSSGTQACFRNTGLNLCAGGSLTGFNGINAIKETGGWRITVL